MKNYFLIKNKEILIYDSSSLFSYYRDKGLVTMSDLVNDKSLDEFLDKQKLQGEQIYELSEFRNARITTIKCSKVGQEYFFDNLGAAVEFCKLKKLSVAADNYIKVAIIKNLKGSTKSAYAYSWSFVTEDINTDDYKIIII